MSDIVIPTQDLLNSFCSEKGYIIELLLEKPFSYFPLRDGRNKKQSVTSTTFAAINNENQS